MAINCLSRPWLVLVVGGAVVVVLCLKVRHVQARLVFRLGYAILCSNILPLCFSWVVLVFHNGNRAVRTVENTILF